MSSERNLMIKRNAVTSRLGWASRVLCLACTLAGLVGTAWPQDGFKITFSTERRSHGRVLNGGVEDASRLGGILGWHLHDDDRLRLPSRWDITTQSVGGDVAVPGVVLRLNGPESVPFTFFTRAGDTTFTPSDLSYGEVFRPSNLGGVAIERVPFPTVVSLENAEDDDPALLRLRSGGFWLSWTAYRTVQRSGYYLQGEDRILAAWSADGRNWSQPMAVTGGGDHFRSALGEDSQGRVWCVYALQEELGSGNFDLYAKSFENGTWSDAVRLTDDVRPDAHHRLATAPDGTLYLVWAGFRDSPGSGLPQSDILLRRFDGTSWGPEVNITNSTEDDWEPAVAADASGNAWVAWDSYRAAGYDLLLKPVTPRDEGRTIEVSASPFAEMRADVAVDGSGKVWVAWEEGSVNWGKDYGYKNERHRINLKQGSRLYDPRGPRMPRVAVLDSGKWFQPKELVTSSAKAGWIQSCSRIRASPSTEQGIRGSCCGTNGAPRVDSAGISSTSTLPPGPAESGWLQCCCPAAPGGRTRWWRQRPGTAARSWRRSSGIGVGCLLDCPSTTMFP